MTEATTEIVLGPPGTGKTTTLLGIVDEELARGTPPDRIGYVSFTRRAAEEAVTRAVDRFGLQRADLPYFRTLHSLCFWRLGLSRRDVLEGDRLKQFASEFHIKINGRFSEDGLLTGYTEGDRAIHLINLARLQRRDLREVYNAHRDEIRWTEVERTRAALARYKEETGLLDYTDMLERFAGSGLGAMLDVLIVDEAQDLSALQWLVVSRLAQGCRRVAVAGDDDQALYPWAGAAVEHFIALQGSVRVLGKSYRVPRRVQEVASRVISNVRHRRDKPWEARGEDGVVDAARDFGSVAIATEGSVMVLVRNVFLLREVVEPALRGRGVLYEVNERPSISPKVLGAVLSWEALRRGEAVTIDEARRVYEQMASGTGVARGHKELPGHAPDEMVTLEGLRQQGGLIRQDIWWQALERLPSVDRSYMLALLRAGERPTQRPRIRVSTIHGSKGGEAGHVVLLREMAQRTHREMTEVSAEDEARVWYVAVTRAQSRLTVVEPRVRDRQGRALRDLACPWI